MGSPNKIFQGASIELSWDPLFGAGWGIPHKGRNFIWSPKGEFTDRCTQEPARYLRLVFLKIQFKLKAMYP